jgi:YegS/Rv2252/BmrU family lipid kinase
VAGAVQDRLRSHGLDFEMVTTSGPGDAVRLARDAAGAGFSTLVSVGGDGTANEVLNGLMQAGSAPEDVALGVLPIGTGNDFAFGAGVSLDLEEACRIVARGHTELVDVGWVHADNEEPIFFGNGVGMGFDARANIESRKVKYLRGMPVYLVAAIRTLAFYYHSPQTQITVDGTEIEQPSLLVSVMNGRRLGGGFYTTPTSLVQDGVFDLCLARKVSRAKMVSFLPRFMRGTHTGDPAITMLQGRKITVVSDSPWAAHVDGEIYGVGAQRYEIELFPRRLSLLC